MNRRRLLAAGGVGLATLGGYAAWSGYRSPSTPDGMDAETRYAERNVLTGGESADHYGLPSRATHHATIADAEAAAEAIEDIDSVTTFVEDTDFDRSYLVVAQTGMQSQPDLVLDRIERTADGLRFEISVDAPWFGVNDDLLTHSLLVRISDEREGLPGEITLDIEGYV